MDMGHERQGEKRSPPSWARCGQTFDWMEGYLAQETPGRGQPPPGVGHWGPRVYCPECGALVAEMLLPLDDERGIWFGENALVNEGAPAPPSYGLFGWREIPLRHIPLYEEHELDIEAVRAHEQQQQAQPPKQEPTGPAPWKEALDEARSAHLSGSRPAALAALERSVALGLQPTCTPMRLSESASRRCSAGNSKPLSVSARRASKPRLPAGRLTRCWQ